MPIYARYHFIQNPCLSSHRISSRSPAYNLFPSSICILNKLMCRRSKRFWITSDRRRKDFRLGIWRAFQQAVSVERNKPGLPGAMFSGKKNGKSHRRITDSRLTLFHTVSKAGHTSDCISKCDEGAYGSGGGKHPIF